MCLARIHSIRVEQQHDFILERLVHFVSAVQTSYLKAAEAMVCFHRLWFGLKHLFVSKDDPTVAQLHLLSSGLDITKGMVSANQTSGKTSYFQHDGSIFWSAPSHHRQKSKYTSLITMLRFIRTIRCDSSTWESWLNIQNRRYSIRMKPLWDILSCAILFKSNMRRTHSVHNSVVLYILLSFHRSW